MVIKVIEYATAELAHQADQSIQTKITDKIFYDFGINSYKLYMNLQSVINY